MPAALTVALASAKAAAYCRTRTCEFTNNIPCPVDDLTGCYTGGAPVFWSNTCFRFAIQRDGSVADSIEAEDLEAIVDAGFRSWSEVSCPGGGSPPISAGSQGLIACAEVEYNCEEPEANSNIVTFRDEFEDTPTFRQGTIALTTLTANLRTGEIFDADIEINSRDEDFTIGPENGTGLERDLNGVINHELGHLLGLGHSDDRRALMFPAYEGRIAPAEDDITAICEVMRGVAADPACTVERLDADAECLGSNIACARQVAAEDPGGGCSCRAAGAERAGAPPWASLGALSLGFLGLLRRSSRARRVL